MGLKCNNPYCEIVSARKLNIIKQFFQKIVKIAFKNESYELLCQEDAQIAQRIQLFITFTSRIQMQWIKASHVNKNIFYKKKENYENLISSFGGIWVQTSSYSTFLDLAPKGLNCIFWPT